MSVQDLERRSLDDDGALRESSEERAREETDRKTRVPSLQLPDQSERSSPPGLDYTTQTVSEKESSSDRRRRLRRSRRKPPGLTRIENEKTEWYLHIPDKDRSKPTTFTLSIAGAWRGPIDISSEATVRDLKKAIQAKSGIHYTYQRLSISGTQQTAGTVLDDNYSFLRRYGIASRFRILCINAKPNEEARLQRLRKLREKKRRRKHETLKAKLEREKRRARRAQQLSDWRLDMHGNLCRQGKVTYPNGAVYDGEWQNQKRHGRGILIDANGDRYEGTFENGVPHGEGKRVYAFVMIEGKLVKGIRTYDGGWRHGMYHGQGRYVVGNGEVYEGEFEKGMYHGRGEYKYKDGRVYDGEWIRGHQSGVGKMTYPNGDVYEGFWKMGRYEGKGRLVLRRAGQIEGAFRMGRIHGKGTRVYADGRTFEGTFYHGERKKGRLEISPEEWCEGDWERGVMHGTGTMRWRDGTTYVGQWVDGYPWGKGKMTYSDGGYYEGEFKSMTDSTRYIHGVSFPKPDGLRQGFGTRVYVSGAVYRGHFFKGLPHGEGTLLSLYKGWRYEGTFQHGQRHGNGTCYYFPVDDDAITYECPAGWSHRNLPMAKREKHEVVRDREEKRKRLKESKTEHAKDREEERRRKTIERTLKMLEGEERFRFDPRRTCIYKGEWSKDVFHGDGTFYCCDGRKYAGKYCRGKRHGYGTQRLVPRQERGDPKRMFCGGVDGLYRPYEYVGEWVNDRPCGKGSTRFAPPYGVVEGTFTFSYLPDGHARVKWPSSGKVLNARYERGWRTMWSRRVASSLEKSDEILRPGTMWTTKFPSTTHPPSNIDDAATELSERMRTALRIDTSTGDDNGGNTEHDVAEEEDWIMACPPVLGSPQLPPSLPFSE